MARALRLVHRVGYAHELVQLALELGPLLQERARERRVPRARLLDERRADRGGFGTGQVVEHALRHALGDEQLVVVTEARDEPSLLLELPVADRPELLENFYHAQELLPVGAAELLELAPADAETLGDGLELAPLAVTAGGGPPRAAVALDRGERGLGTLRALAVDQLGDRQPLELGGQMAQPSTVHGVPVATLTLTAVTLVSVALAVAPRARSTALAPVAPAVAGHVQRRRRPEDALDHAALYAHGGSVRKERVDEHAVAADGVDPEHHRQSRRPAAPHQDETSRLGLRHRPLPAPAAHAPAGSIPRRPARPAIWVSSLCDSERNPRSVRLVSPCRTTERAGM